MRAVTAEIAAAGQRRRPAGIVEQQGRQLGLERLILLRIEERGLELLQRRHQDFRHIGAAEGAEAAAHQHDAASPRTAGRSASKKAATRFESFQRGTASTPEPTSSA